jgi:sugar/nucleoside kinase (ribokinase family)
MRNGILAAGNFIRDYVKIIGHYPEQDTLASILSETSGNGGGPYNVLKDLAAMGATYPLEAAGLVGKDTNGDWILADCVANRIGTAQLQQTDVAPTSYTDAMTVASTGRRTFFHQRGANALFTEAHLDFSKTNAKLLHLGYLMLLDAMDSFTEDGLRTRASLALEQATKAGLITCVDMVSTENEAFREIAASAMAHTDYLIINEIEAGKSSSRQLKTPQGTDTKGCVEAAQWLIQESGVRQQVVIHFTEGAVAADKNGEVTLQGSLRLPDGFIVGATGAGDAFAAGYLHGLHEGWDTRQRLELGVCAAAACLTHPTPSGGLRSVAACFELGEKLGYQEIETRRNWC